MRRLLLASAAVACLAIGLPAVHAQQGQDNPRERPPAAGAPQQTSPQADDQRNNRATPRREQSSGQGQAAPRASSGDNQTRTGDDSRQRGTTGARTQNRDAAPGRAERSRSSEQAGDRPREGGQQARDPMQRNQARDDRRDRAEQERSTTRERSGDRERSTTGQSTREPAPEPRRSTSEPRRSNETLRSDGDRRDRADSRDSRRGAISLTAEQRSRVSSRFATRIDRLNVQSIPRSRLSVSIGVIVPSSIRLYDVSPDIVEIYPGFRGHKFVVVEDDIVIIEPRSRRIVTTIPRDGGRSARAEGRITTGAAPSGDRVRFSPEQRIIIRETVLREPMCRYEQRLEFFLVIPIPTTVRVCEFPERVVMEVPEVRRYRYLTRGDDVLIVDPDEHRVVEVLD